MPDVLRRPDLRLLSNILQAHNINSNLQLVLKGVIIIGRARSGAQCYDLLAQLRLPGASRRRLKEIRPPRADVGRDVIHDNGGKEEMKRRDIIKLTAFAAVLAATTVLMPGTTPCSGQESFASASARRRRSKPWRAQFNKESSPRRAKHRRRADHNRR